MTLPKCFWLFASLDLIVLLVLLAVHLRDKYEQGNASSGFDMMSYFIMMPAILLVFALLLFQFSASLYFRIAATLIVVKSWLAADDAEPRNTSLASQRKTPWPPSMSNWYTASGSPPIG